ncbi:hypothetical protein BMJ35_13910 [Sinorhizobium medicae]|uniref:hypothetical protein n=1 Tax=Sinorhizobium medicae TaxID=110321 RepID=UPI000C7E4ECD|nr:hypothetical protein [Sinorhizobium medicae]PLT89638.1 hypothetical protein BMJ35_13910 [Sinorhizobium medicae]
MIKLNLPYPPSGWDLYQGWGEKRRLSPTYKKWRNDAGYFIKVPAAPIDKPFALHVALRRQNMRQDIDNRSKAILLTMCWDSDLPAECVVIIQVCEEGMAA